MSNMQVLGLVIMMLLMMELATSVTFDYYKLALQWPPEVCATGRCPPNPPIPQLFTIHGLWPSNWPPNQYTIPPGKRAYYRSITNVENELNTVPVFRDWMTRFWPDLYDPMNPSRFWTHEYNNHALVIGPPIPSPVSFFQMAGRLFLSLNNVLDRLKQRGIEPSNDITKWTRASVFQQTAGDYPTLICDPTPVPPYYTYRLLEIHYCSNTASPPALMSCYHASLRTCGGPGGNITFRAL